MQQALSYKAVQCNGHRSAAYAETLGQVPFQEKIAGLALGFYVVDNEPIGFLLGVFLAFHVCYLPDFRERYPRCRDL